METGEVRGYTEFGIDGIIEGIRGERAEALANARRVLRLYGWVVPDGINVVTIPEGKAAVIALAVDWYYHGASGWSYGRDESGHNYEQSPGGKLKRIYSLNQRNEAVAYARRYGAAKAGRKYDVPAKTIRSWMNRGN